MLSKQSSIRSCSNALVLMFKLADSAVCSVFKCCCTILKSSTYLYTAAATDLLIAYYYNALQILICIEQMPTELIATCCLAIIKNQNRIYSSTSNVWTTRTMLNMVQRAPQYHPVCKNQGSCSYLHDYPNPYVKQTNQVD